MTEKEMTWIDHLGELRKRLIWVFLSFVIDFIIGFFVAGPVVAHIKQDPAAAQITWHVFGISDALRIYMQVAFVIALVLTLPVLLYQFWAFISPGLLENERKAVRMYLPFSVFLLLLGLAFGYYGLFPMIIRFMTGMSHTIGAQEAYGLTQYFQFMFNLVVPIGLLFELPVVIMFLTTLRLINPLLLVKFRKYAILLSVVTAAMITPPDLVSHLMAAIPLYLLYELSVWLSKWVYRRQLAKDRELNPEEEEKEEEFATIDTGD